MYNNSVISFIWFISACVPRSLPNYKDFVIVNFLSLHLPNPCQIFLKSIHIQRFYRCTLHRTWNEYGVSLMPRKPVFDIHALHYLISITNSLLVAERFQNLNNWPWLWLPGNFSSSLNILWFHRSIFTNLTHATLRLLVIIRA